MEINSYFCVAHVVPGLFLLGMTYVSDEPYMCVAFMTLSLGFNGASTVTNLQNCHDLAPNYAATLYGIMNTAGTTAGFITPLVVAFFTQEQVGYEATQKFAALMDFFFLLLFRIRLPNGI